MQTIWENIFKSPENAQTVYDFLGKIPIFLGLKPRELKAVERIVHCRQYKPDEIIFRKNDPGVGMYLIRSGAVRIVLTSATEDAKRPPKELLLARLVPGDFFGEASLPDGGARSATAIADDETTLIGLFRPDLLDLCDRDPSTGIKVLWNICEVLAVRLRKTNLQLSHLTPVNNKADKR